MTAAQPRLADFLPYLLSVATNVVSDRIADEYHLRFGLKIPEWRVMAVLGDTGPQTQRSLVGATRMDKVAVNRACKVLEQRGLAARRPNSTDGRSHHLALSASGTAMHRKIMPLALDMERRLFAGFDAAERQQFKTLLARLQLAAGQLEGSR